MRKILAFISGRADGSPLDPVTNALDDRPDVDCVETRFISKYPEIVTLEAISSIEFDEPDIVLLLGDRYETLLVATAATYLGIPIAHIHGGEVTEGSVDNQYRDAVTILSHLHFCATPAAQQRLVLSLHQRGETVFLTGAPGLDNCERIMKEDHGEKTNEVVLTWLPPTAPGEDPMRGLECIVDAYWQLFPDGKYDVVWTGTNNDPGAGLIDDYMREAVKHMGPPFIDATDMTPDQYLRRVRDAAFVIGNSSSTIIESNTLQTFGIDVGNRQKGRLRPSTVFHCEEDTDKIIKQIETVTGMIDEGWDNWARRPNPYYRPNAPEVIATILAETNIEEIRRK